MGVNSSKKLYEIQRNKAHMRQEPYNRAARMIRDFNTLGMDPDSPEYSERTRSLILAAEGAGLKPRDFKAAGIKHTSITKAHNGTDPEVSAQACANLLAAMLERF